MNVLNYSELVQDVVMGLEVELMSFPFITDVEVKCGKRGSWYNFQLKTSQEFLSDDELNKVFELILDANFSLRSRTGGKIYFTYSIVGVQKYFVEDQEFDNYSNAFQTAKKLTEKEFKGLDPSHLIEIREI